MTELYDQGKIDILFQNLHQEEFLISVTDNGIGLPEGEAKENLSEPYVTHREKGTGLGLAIVKKIMEDHEGQLIIGNTKKLTELEEWEDIGGASVSLFFPFHISSTQDSESEQINLPPKKVQIK